MTQSQFLSWVLLVWMHNFPSPWLVALSKLKKPVRTTICPSRVGEEMNSYFLPEAFAGNETQTFAFRILTQLSYYDNCYANSSSFAVMNVLLVSMLNKKASNIIEMINYPFSVMKYTIVKFTFGLGQHEWVIPSFVSFDLRKVSLCDKEIKKEKRQSI